MHQMNIYLKTTGGNVTVEEKIDRFDSHLVPSVGDVLLYPNKRLRVVMRELAFSTDGGFGIVYLTCETA
jgi:hypothetical protein